MTASKKQEKWTFGAARERCMKVVLKAGGFILGSIIGGYAAVVIMSWEKAATIPAASDAIAIANTYIVFTSFIFVAFTAVLAVAGYVFTQQFTAGKTAQINDVVDDIKERVGNDERIGIALMNALIENSDVKQHLDEMLQSKIDQVIREKAADFEASASQANSNLRSVEALRAQINPTAYRRRPPSVNGGENPIPPWMREDSQKR